MYKVRLKKRDLINEPKTCYNIDLKNNEMDVLTSNDDVIKDYRIIIKKLIKKYFFYIVGFIFYIIVLYLNSIRIDNIVFLNDYKENEEICLYIKSNMSDFLGFKTINNIDDISNELRIKYNDFEWIELSKEGNDLIVNIIKCDYYEQHNKSIGDIVAKKDGLVKEIVVTKGLSNVYYNKYVKKGDVLISSNNMFHSSGKVFAEVNYYESIKVNKKELQKNYISYNETFGIKIFNKNFIFNKNKTNCDIIELKCFNLGFFKVYNYALKEKIVYEYEYDLSNARRHSKEIINHKMIESEILEVKELGFEEYKEYYIFNYFIKTKEDIAVFRSG